MNIFILDNDKTMSAQYHADKHLVKMILEQTQILSSAYYFTEFIPVGIYKLTHANHPCCKWARENKQNWLWLKEMTEELCKEFEYRYGKTHKCFSVLKIMPEPMIIDGELTPFAQAMPDQYKNANAVIAYRNYYIGEKSHLFVWKKREVPNWINVKLN